MTSLLKVFAFFLQYVLAGIGLGVGILFFYLLLRGIESVLKNRIRERDKEVA